MHLWQQVVVQGGWLEEVVGLVGVKKAEVMKTMALYVITKVQYQHYCKA